MNIDRGKWHSLVRIGNLLRVDAGRKEEDECDDADEEESYVEEVDKGVVRRVYKDAVGEEGDGEDE